MDPRIGAVINPTLIDRSGTATYIGTPRGHNDFYEIWKKSQIETDLLYSSMPKASETGLIADDALEVERRRMSENDYARIRM